MKDTSGFSSSKDYSPPGHKSSTIRGAKMDDGDSVGVGTGLSALSGFDSENPLSPVVKNKTGRTSLGKKSVKSKGESMDMC
jgi:hypothetical protein